MILGLQRRRVHLFLFGLALFVVLIYLPRPAGLSAQGQRAMAWFAFVIYLWVTEVFALPVTALAAGAGLIVLGIRTNPDLAFMPYAQDAIFMILGSLILAEGLVYTRADQWLAFRYLTPFLSGKRRLLFGVVLVSASMATVLPDHGVVALLLPIVLNLIHNSELRDDPDTTKALVIAVAYGATVAGLSTPSGGARNVIALGYMRQLTGIQFAYWRWVLFNLPITILLVPTVYVVLRRVFQVPKSPIRIEVDSDRKPLTPAQKRALLILGLTLVLFMTLGARLGLGVVAMIGSVAMLATGVLPWEHVSENVAWGVVYIYGAALTLASALQDTGAAAWIAEAALGMIQSPGVFLFTAAVIPFVVAATNLMSAGATTAALLPILLPMAATYGFPPQLIAMTTAIASAFAFVNVVGTPPNIIVYSSGTFSSGDLARAGAVLTLIAVVVALLVMRFYWPLIGPQLFTP